MILTGSLSDPIIVIDGRVYLRTSWFEISETLPLIRKILEYFHASFLGGGKREGQGGGFLEILSISLKEYQITAKLPLPPPSLR